MFLHSNRFHNHMDNGSSNNNNRLYRCKAYLNARIIICRWRETLT